MPLSPGNGAPALPPRRNPPPIPQPQEEEEYDEFDTCPPPAPPLKKPNFPPPSPVDDQQDYDEFDVAAPTPSQGGVSVYELDGNNSPEPMLHVEEEYSFADEEEENGSENSDSSDRRVQPPPLPPIGNKKKNALPPFREKKLSSTSSPGGIDLALISAAKSGLKKITKEIPSKKEENKIKFPVALKPVAAERSPKEKQVVVPVINNVEIKPTGRKVSFSDEKIDIDSLNTQTQDDSFDDGEIYDDAESLPEDPLRRFEWYHENITRKQTEERIKKINKDGTYLIRKSDKLRQPYTMGLLYEGRIRNLKVRLRSDSTFALGEAKDNETTFSTVEELVTHHKKHDVNLIGEHRGNITLKYPASNK